MNQLFYTTHIDNQLASLDGEESRHLLTVLRRQPGDRLDLTDGKGFFYEGEIADIGKKHTLVRILKTMRGPEPVARLHIAIAPTKQMDRFEWFLEKATEIGVQKITPLLCKRSERTSIRPDRLEKILIAAMKQSLQSHLPLLAPLTGFQQLMEQATEPQRFIAWCPNEPPPPLITLLQPASDCLILIGPEGDFTLDEVAYALEQGFKPTGLGPTRLRTETAGLVAVTTFHLLQN